MKGLTSLLASLKTMAEKQKSMFKKVRKVVKRTQKVANEMKSQVQKETKETRSFVLSHNAPTESTIL